MSKTLLRFLEGRTVNEDDGEVVAKLASAYAQVYKAVHSDRKVLKEVKVESNSKISGDDLL